MNFLISFAEALLNKYDEVFLPQNYPCYCGSGSRRVNKHELNKISVFHILNLRCPTFSSSVLFWLFRLKSIKHLLSLFIKPVLITFACNIFLNIACPALNTARIRFKFCIDNNAIQCNMLWWMYPIA